MKSCTWTIIEHSREQLQTHLKRKQDSYEGVLRDRVGRRSFDDYANLQQLLVNVQTEIGVIATAL